VVPLVFDSVCKKRLFKQAIWNEFNVCLTASVKSEPRRENGSLLVVDVSASAMGTLTGLYKGKASKYTFKPTTKTISNNNKIQLLSFL